MPRIAAPTLVEHRAQQRAALLDAARALVADGDASAVTMAAVAAGAGLARSSVYEYFSSPADLLATIVSEEMTGFAAEMAAAAAPTADPAARVRSYLRQWLRHVGSGSTRLTATIMATPMPPECVMAVDKLHAQIAEPLLVALRELGVADPQRTADLIAGVVNAAGRRIVAGGALRREVAAAEAFITAALDLPD
jgi:AcrR family transcriptional regulator